MNLLLYVDIDVTLATFLCLFPILYFQVWYLETFMLISWEYGLFSLSYVCTTTMYMAGFIFSYFCVLVFLVATFYFSFIML